MPTLDSTAVKFTEHTAPVPLAHLLFGADLLPTITKFRENGGKRHKLRLVRQVAISEDVLQSEEFCSPEEAHQHMIAQGLVLVLWEYQHSAAFAADTCRFVFGFAEPDVLLVAAKGVDKCYCLEEVSVLNATQHIFSSHRWFSTRHLPLRAAIPVVAEAEILGSVGRRQEFEGIENHAASIHLLENMTDGLLLNRLFQLDHGKLVGLKSL